MKKLLTLVAVLALAACGVFNLGATNEDGSPKTAADARLFLRAVGNGFVQTFGTAWLRRAAPDLFAALNSDGNAYLTIEEIEAQIDFTNPNSVTTLMVLAYEMWLAKKAMDADEAGGPTFAESLSARVTESPK